MWVGMGRGEVVAFQQPYEVNGGQEKLVEPYLCLDGVTAVHWRSDRRGRNKGGSDEEGRDEREGEIRDTS